MLTRLPKLKKRSAVLAVFLATSAAIASAQTVVEEIVARVNDQIITVSDLKRGREVALSELQQQLGDEAKARATAKEREKDLLRDLIDQQLLVQKGKDDGINAETEIIKRLDEIRKSMNLDTMEEVEKAAQAQGVSFEDFKNNMRNNIITQGVIGQDVGRKIQIKPEEIKEYYDLHQKDFEHPELIELAEILASTEPPVGADGKKPTGLMAESPELTAKAEAKAKRMLDEIKAGAKFEDVAKKESGGPTADQGGALGEFRRGMLAKELEDKTFTLKVGEVSDVIRTRQGFIILKVLKHEPAGVAPMKQVEREIYDSIYYVKLQPALRQFLMQLREEAYVDVKQGYVDSGASPNQTKPIYTTALSEEGKAGKKKKKKFILF